MKTKKFFTALPIALLAFTACSNDDDVNNSREEVKIVASINGATDNKLRASFNADGSGDFEPGDEYSLFFWSQTSSSGGAGSYKADGSEPWYWDALSPDSSPIDFLAWYPVFNPIGPTIQAYKVANAASPQAQDLLMSTKVPAVTKNNIVNLQFGHIMHKLVISLSTNYYSTTDLSFATVNLVNLKSDASVDFMNGTVDETAASGTDSYAQATGKDVSFIVAPQSLVVNTEIIHIVIAGKTFVWKVPAILTTLESGKILTLNLSINRDVIVLQSGSISPWSTQASIHDVIEFN